MARQHEAAGEMVRQVTMAVRQAQRVIDRPAGRVYAGPCDCGLDLYARPGQPHVTCRGCGAVHEVASRQEWMRAQLDDHLGNASWCAAIVTALGREVSPSTIRVWASRKRLIERPGGLFRVGDVMDRVVERDRVKAERDARAG